jgi:hypothetical protein
MLAGFLLQAERVRHVTGLKVTQYARMLLESAACSIAVPVVWLAAQTFFRATRPLTSLAYGVLGCLFAYAMAGAALLRQWHSTGSLRSNGSYLPPSVTAEHADL